MFPQIDATESNPLMGGFGYLEDNRSGCFHPGVDFNSGSGGNADCGSSVVAITTQSLQAHIVDVSGFGIHQWWLLEEGPAAGSWAHYCHLSSVNFTEPGTIAHRGEPIAAVGRTGGWDFCHLHFEIKREAPPMKMSGVTMSRNWGYWPKGQSREEVASQYLDPIEVAHAYNSWSEEETMSPEMKLIADVLAETGYSPSEVPDLIRAVAAWSANAGSLAAWIEEIGALKAKIAELESTIAQEASSDNT